jgi:hypothetical protein
VRAVKRDEDEGISDALTAVVLQGTKMKYERKKKGL